MNRYYLFCKTCGIRNLGHAVVADNKRIAKKGFCCTQCGKKKTIYALDAEKVENGLFEDLRK
jgi:hypothetical protein